MIFCGDIALPFENAVSFSIPKEMLQKEWIGNLEGSLVKEKSEFLKKSIVYNSFFAIGKIASIFNFRVFNLANNHILDAAEINTTQDNLSKIKVQYLGAGKNYEEANKELIIGDYVLVSFGWDGINCIYAEKEKQGVNPYTKQNVFSTIEILLKKYEGKKIITLFHWNYELELYPQPIDRQIAHKLVDFGVYSVIGCHAHRVQPIEIYKGHPIVYGLGNFAFRQSAYMNHRLKFPDFTVDEYAFELANNGQFILHKFIYDKEKHKVSYVGITQIPKCDFEGLSDKEYVVFFEKNRYQRKALPIIRFEDNIFVYRCKLLWIKFRNKITLTLSKNQKIFKAIKSLVTRVYGH